MKGFKNIWAWQPKPITYMNFVVEKSVLLMHSCLWSYLKTCMAQLAEKSIVLRSACEKERHVPDYPFK